MIDRKKKPKSEPTVYCTKQEKITTYRREKIARPRTEGNCQCGQELLWIAATANATSVEWCPKCGTLYVYDKEFIRTEIQSTLELQRRK